ncbi:polymorphic toxin type 24 domain-containing protein [Sinomicrobium sp. M5D2P9]
MKLFHKILFFTLVIFSTNISEAKIIILERIVSEINKTLHFDLQVATHKGVPTSHIQQSLPNVNPKTGQVFWNKDRQWVQPMTQQDIRIIRNYLKSQ